MNSEDSPSLPLKRQRHNRKSVYGCHHSSSAPSSSSTCCNRDRTASDHQIPHCSKRNTEELGTEEKTDGYNSSDEYGEPPPPCTTGCGQKDSSSFDIVEMEKNFEHDLREEKGFNIKEMATDGACLFRAVADQIYGDQEMHGVVRRHCMDYMVKNRDFFSQYVTEDFNSYIGRKRNEHSHGNHIEMQALSEMYNRPIEVYQYSTQPINTFHSRTLYSSNDDTPPIRLSYHGNVHYNSIIDPYNPTVGVGLGLAGYKPGTEEEELINNCVKESETSQLEQAMLEDKLKATDWETADEDIAEMVARESYLQWLKDNQKSKNDTSSSTASTSAKSHSPPKELTQKSPPRKSPSRKSPPRKSPPRTTATEHDTTTTLSNQQTACCSTNTLPNPQPGYTADWQYSEWGDDSLLAAVLAQSQQDYLQEMERQAPSSSSKK